MEHVIQTAAIDQLKNDTGRTFLHVSVQGEGAWRRLAMYPDNFTYLSVIGRISAGAGGVVVAVTNTHARACRHISGPQITF